MNTEIRNVRGLALCLMVLSVVTVLLYSPYRLNPAVFDDHNIITNLGVYSYAQQIFPSSPRVFPYFTIGLVHVLSGANLAWNRALSIVLHSLVVLALFFFLRRSTSGIETTDAAIRERICFLVSAWMALNPVAVYGVAYLVQRTIVFATLFGLLSAILYLRAQQQSRSVDVLSASLMAGLSMMSKEHAVLLPAAVVALTPLVCCWDRAAIQRATGYMAFTLPCAIWVLLHRGVDFLGSSYEGYSGDIALQLGEGGGLPFPGGLWPMSIATQLLLFWKYLFLWLVPNPQWMSADMRVDVPVLWDSAWAYVGLSLSVGFFMVVAICWFHRGIRAWIRRWAAVLAFVAIPFVVELSVVRVQEPFVLYRSYLWMPGYALLFALMFMTVDRGLTRWAAVWPRKTFWGIVLIACSALFPLAQDRLRSFSSEEALWLDAVVKLPRSDVVGADRIYYNLAVESYKRKNYKMALDWSDRVIAQNPRAFQGYLVQGTSWLALGDPHSAMQSFDAAAARQPPASIVGQIEFYRCRVMEVLGEREAMLDCLRRSAKMGYEMARFRLQMIGAAE